MTNNNWLKHGLTAAIVISTIGTLSYCNFLDKKKTEYEDKQREIRQEQFRKEMAPLELKLQNQIQENDRQKKESMRKFYEQEEIKDEYLPNTRGIKNYNPGNIRSNGTPWKGLSGVDEKGFCKFKSHEYGLRALAKNLQTYDKKHDADTITEIVSRWAPSKENNTNEYINFVSKQTGYNPNQELDLTNKETLGKLTKAIANYDSGAKYSDRRIKKALDLL